jgi:hypothetical protein
MSLAQAGHVLRGTASGRTNRRSSSATKGGTFRRRVREMVTTGELPCDDPVSLWAGMGDGKRCAACAEPIATREVEYESVLAEPGTTMPAQLARSTP